MVTEVIQGEQEIESAAEEERFARLFNLLAARFNIFSPDGGSMPSYRDLNAYLRTVFGALPEGATDYDAVDLDGDGINEFVSVDENGEVLTVYDFDED